MKCSRLIAWLAAGTAVVLMAARGAPQVDPEPAAEPPRGAARQVVVIPVPLPLTGSVDQQVIAAADKTLKSLRQNGQRPIVVFEFRPRDEALLTASTMVR